MGERGGPLMEYVTARTDMIVLAERDALLDKIRKAPEFVQFMTELKTPSTAGRRARRG
jgi:hypothetical protein